ncbi:MAG: DsbA family oxidoreductase [Pseudomonadota bacterium]
MSAGVVRITIGFDFICPWCLIGLRHLQQALLQLHASLPGVRVHIEWQGRQLLPHTPGGGLPFRSFYLQRLGSEQAVRQRQHQVSTAAEAAGARVDYDRIERISNTADAHRLLQHVQQHGSAAQRDRLLESLMVAYFERGEDLADPDILLTHALAAGVATRPLLTSLQGAAVPFASRGGGSSVPSYSFSNGLSISGAQGPAVLLAAMQTALVLGEAA